MPGLLSALLTGQRPHGPTTLLTVIGWPRSALCNASILSAFQTDAALRAPNRVEGQLSSHRASVHTSVHLILADDRTVYNLLVLLNLFSIPPRASTDSSLASHSQDKLNMPAPRTPDSPVGRQPPVPIIDHITVGGYRFHVEHHHTESGADLWRLFPVGDHSLGFQAFLERAFDNGQHKQRRQ